MISVSGQFERLKPKKITFKGLSYIYIYSGPEIDRKEDPHQKCIGNRATVYLGATIR